MGLLSALRRRPDPAHENTLRRALHAEAERTVPHGGLDQIRARIDKTAARGATRTAEANDCEESQAMPIIHHEDASVYGKGVIHHPLSGRPEFKGLIDSPDGPLARIQDGDLVLTIDDLATLIRWRDEFQRAAVQMQLGIARAAANGGTR